MLQNGIDLSTVDVSYVSSRSWYFPRSVFKILVHELMPSEVFFCVVVGGEEFWLDDYR